MKKSWPLPFLLVLVISFTISCGSGSRQLQSISVTQTVNGNQIQFIATGSFSAPPMTVTPLPADWTMGLFAPPPPKYTYTLSTQPFVFQCTSSGPLTVVAFAPPDPKAPMSGSTSHVVTKAATVTCP
jgi:hypothetical protein